MKLDEAIYIIEHGNSGYLVSFMYMCGGSYRDDYFPEIGSYGQECFTDLDDAWDYAKKFAAASPDYRRVHVVHARTLAPVQPARMYNDG